MKDVRHQYRILSKQNDRLKAKIVAAAEATGITVDETTHADLVAVTLESNKFTHDFPPDSFQRVFWEQQMEAAKQKDAQTMRWHPLMIRWCLHLRHR